MKKGLLELCILRIVSDGDIYGYDVMKRAAEVFPGMNESTVYAVLRRMRSLGFAEYYIGSTSEGPARKYYRLTPLGKERLEKLKKEWNELREALRELGL